MKESNIKSKILKHFGNFIFDCSVEQMEYIYSKRHLNSTKNIMKNNKPNSLLKLYYMIKRCVEIGTIMTKEKMFIMYGNDAEIKFLQYTESRKITEINMIKKYGASLGKKKFEEYREKQAYSNSFEYKNKKHNMSLDEYNLFNKSRSITLENLSKKYGKEDGETRYRSYCEKQAFTNSKEHLGEKYEFVNKRKSHTVENYQRRFGIEEGKAQFEKYINKVRSPYSKISQELFFSLLERKDIFGERMYFAEHNHEYGILDTSTGSYKKYDFVSLDVGLCIEFHGDHYHGNPNIYLPHQKLKGKGQTQTSAEDIWKRDEYKKNLLKESRNIDTIVVWESDYLQDKVKTVERIIDYVRQKNKST
jgi:hypothetical protein